MYKEKSTNSLLKIRNVVKEFVLPRDNFFNKSKRIRVLDNISLTVNYAESFGIVGESGCGKSTLAKSVMALESPQSGEIFFKGKSLNSLKTEDLRKMRRGLQMIFQDPYGSLDPRQNIGQIVSEPLILLRDFTPKIKREKVSETLKNVGLSPNDILKFPHEFSGGQRQRIAIARALITRPELIVADEPVSALDVSVQAQVLNLMMDLKEKHGLSYLFISHDLSVVRQITTKVAVMFAGKIVEKGATQTLFNNPQHPYTRDLLEAIPRPDPFRKKQRRIKEFPSSSENTILQTEIKKTGCAYASRCPYVEDQCKINSPSLKNIKGDFVKKTKDSLDIVHKVACHKPLN